MLNSFLIFSSCYNKNKKYSMLFYVALIINLLYVQCGKVSIGFLISNLIIMSAIVLISKKIKNKYCNSIISVISILLWSVAIDLITYYMYPLFATKLSISEYLLNGIIFNLRFVFSNIAFLLCANVFEMVRNKRKVLVKNHN